MPILLKLSASGVPSDIADNRTEDVKIRFGQAFGSRAELGSPSASPKIRPDWPLPHDSRRAARSRNTRSPTMVWSQLTAFAVSALVAVPAYDHVSTLFDSTIVGLMAVSLLLMPVLSVMRCLLDPCAR